MSSYRLGINPLPQLRYRFPTYTWVHEDKENLQGNPRFSEDVDGTIAFRFDLRNVVAKPVREEV
jgi:hypothetical protein